MKKSKYMQGGGKSSKYKAAGGMKTEVGKEAKVQSYNEYVRKMFGGGNTSEPAMKKKRSKGMAGGGMTPARKKKFFDRSNRPTTIAEIQEGLGQVRPGMSKGGKS